MAILSIRWLRRIGIAIAVIWVLAVPVVFPEETKIAKTFARQFIRALPD